jgi:hypothetical protein
MTIDLGFVLIFKTFEDKTHKWTLIGPTRKTESTKIELFDHKGKARISNKRSFPPSVIEDARFILLRFAGGG